MTDEIVVTPLLIIDVPGGPVRRGLKASSNSFLGFGELYFTEVDFGVVKGWKRHLEMTMNLIVTSGRVRFVFLKPESTETKEIVSDTTENYQRITVPPGYWFGFQGGAKEPNQICNIASIEHRDDEVERKDLEELPFAW